MSDGNLAVQAAAEDLVLADRGEDGVLRLTLNAPRSRNALSESMMTALSSALEEAARPAS